MGGALPASRSAPASPPQRQYSRDDGTYDETVGIICRGPDRNYQSMNATNPNVATTATAPELRPRKTIQTTRSQLPPQAEEDEEDYDAVVAREEQAREAQVREPWYTIFLSSFQSIELENRGSVARDHLALGTSLSLARPRSSLQTSAD